MSFKIAIMKVRRALLCFRDEKTKRSLEISSPTDVQRGVLDMPGLTEEQRHFIREKASTDAARLLSLTSHPPTRPPSITSSASPSPASSRSPSTTLLNSASTNLPTTLPTPPRQKHTNPVPPSSAHSRMKGFWENTRRLSNTLSTHSHIAYKDLREGDGDDDESVVLLNIEYQDAEDEVESPISRKSFEAGFDVKDITNYADTDVNHNSCSEIIAKAVQDTEVAYRSDSDNESQEGKDVDAKIEHRPIITA